MVNTELLTRMALYLFVAIILITILNVYTHGFLIKYARVKASRGRKLLVRIRGKITDYIMIGEPIEGNLEYKDASKSQKRVQLPEGAITRFLGVNWAHVDEEKNAVFRTDLKGVEGHDAVRYNNLYLRALYRPTILNNVMKWEIILLIAIVIGLFIIYAKIGNLSAAVTALQQVGGQNI